MVVSGDPGLSSARLLALLYMAHSYFYPKSCWTSTLCNPKMEYIYSDKLAVQIITFNLGEPLYPGSPVRTSKLLVKSVRLHYVLTLSD